MLERTETDNLIDYLSFSFTEEVCTINEKYDIIILLQWKGRVTYDTRNCINR